MPRPLKPIEEGLIYHVIARGNNRQNVFHKEGDFKAFLQALADLKQRRPFELFGYCLMSNHFHLLLKPRGAPVSRILQSLLVSHTQRYHKQRGIVSLRGSSSTDLGAHGSSADRGTDAFGDSPLNGNRPALSG